MDILSRSHYASKVDSWLGKGQIIVLTGQRRVGKSFVMKDFINRHETLLDGNIIYIDKEKKEFDSIKTYVDLNNYLDGRLVPGTRTFILVDEIQDIDGWENSVRSYRTDEDTDIIISGSNSKMLSGELGTRIGGRYVEIPIHSLTYLEFLDFHNLDNNDESLRKFLEFGGLPGLRRVGIGNDEHVWEYLKGVFNTIVLKDVIERHSIRNIPFLNNLIRYYADTIGKLSSATNIKNVMKVQGQDVSTKLVQEYSSYLEEAYLLHNVSRYDVHGKKLFESNGKEYFEDIGLRNLITESGGGIERIIENVIHNQLVYDGYDVKVGQLRIGEIDFVCYKPGGKRAYVQASYIIGGEDTWQREFGRLASIKDSYPKYVISMTPLVKRVDENGITHISLREFLTSGL